MITIKSDSITHVGDIHCNSVTPRSRLDDFSVTSLSKLRQVKDICIKNEYKLVIISGDTFHRNKQPVSYLNAVKRVFKEIKDSGIIVYVICGNHDLLYDKMENLDRSPLGNLLLAGDLIRPLDELLVKTSQGFDIYIKGFDFPDEISPVNTKIDCNLSMCVAHKFFNGAYGVDNLTTEDVNGLGYGVYALGHDHISYEPVRTEKSLVVRPGSLLRGTSHDYNLTREVCIDTLKFTANVGKLKLNFVRDKLDIEVAENVFSSAVFHKKQENPDLMLNLSDSIDNLLIKMSNIKGGSSVYTVLDEMDVSDEIKERIEMYLENYGIFREVGV